MRQAVGEALLTRESLQEELERLTDLGGSASFPCAHALLVERIASGQLAESSRPAAPAGGSASKPGQSRDDTNGTSGDGDAERNDEGMEGAEGEEDDAEGARQGASNSGKVGSLLRAARCDLSTLLLTELIAPAGGDEWKGTKKRREHPQRAESEAQLGLGLAPAVREHGDYFGRARWCAAGCWLLGRAPTMRFRLRLRRTFPSKFRIKAILRHAGTRRGS